MRTGGDLYIYDIQAYHEASFYCTVFNGRDRIKSDLVNVTIIGECWYSVGLLFSIAELLAPLTPFLPSRKTAIYAQFSVIS